MSAGTLTIMGCADSCGVPRVGNDWGECDPKNPRNLRTRASACLCSASGTTLMIDSGPDFKQQCNREGLTRMDGVLYTHAHSDHINGIDELRAWHDLQNRTKVKTWANEATYAELERRFDYIFTQQTPFYPAIAEKNVIEQGAYGQLLEIGDIKIIPFEQDHGTMKSVGYRVGDIAYSTDMVNLPDASIEVLRGIKIWVADCANLEHPSPKLHANLPRLLELKEKIGVKTVFVTHMKNNWDYERLRRTLPNDIYPAFDGLKISWEGDILTP